MEQTAVDKLLKTKWGSEDSDTTHWDVFVDRLLELDGEYECDNTVDGSKQILKDIGCSDTETEELVEWFEENGGYCDCEVLMNVVFRVSPEKLGEWFIPPDFWTTQEPGAPKHFTGFQCSSCTHYWKDYSCGTDTKCPKCESEDIENVCER